MKRSAHLLRHTPLKRSAKRMKSGRSTGTPTKLQRERFEAIKAIGCIVARLLGLGFVPCEVHHLTGGLHGQRRQGHDFTVGLNPWSHRGDWQSVAINREEAERIYDVSYARNPRRFRERFPDELLLDEQNRLIAEWRRNTLGACA